MIICLAASEPIYSQKTLSLKKTSIPVNHTTSVTTTNFEVEINWAELEPQVVKEF